MFLCVFCGLKVKQMTHLEDAGISIYLCIEVYWQVSFRRSSHHQSLNIQRLKMESWRKRSVDIRFHVFLFFLFRSWYPSLIWYFPIPSLHFLIPVSIFLFSGGGDCYTLSFFLGGWVFPYISHIHTAYTSWFLGGGFKHFYFHPYLGKMIQFDDCAYCSRWVGSQPPTRWWFKVWIQDVRWGVSFPLLHKPYIHTAYI